VVSGVGYLIDRYLAVAAFFAAGISAGAYPHSPVEISRCTHKELYPRIQRVEAR
jgi:hypothetical protein